MLTVASTDIPEALPPAYRGAPAELYAAYAPGKSFPPRIRHFVDPLAKAFRRIQQDERRPL